MSNINPDIFRRYDIRGVVPDDFDEGGIEQIGHALVDASNQNFHLLHCSNYSWIIFLTSVNFLSNNSWVPASIFNLMTGSVLLARRLNHQSG